MVGAAVFGIGWGLSCMCPGTGMMNFYVFNQAVFWILAMWGGEAFYDHCCSKGGIWTGNK